jgi:ABC-2 type transport system permease protein
MSAQPTPTHARSTFGAAFDVAGSRRVPFLRLVQVEMRKMADTRAGLWLLIITGAIIVVAIAAVAWTNRSTGADFTSYFLSSAVPQTLLFPVLSILLITGEWTQRTTLTTFALEPSRMRVMAAKLSAALLYGFLGMVLAAVVGSLATLAFGSPDPWEGAGFGLFVNLFLLQTVGVLMGAALGALLLTSAGAIVLFFVLPVIFSIVVSFVPFLRDHQQWFDLSIAQMPLMNDVLPVGEEWAYLGTASLIWIVLPLALGLLRISRMEFK